MRTVFPALLLSLVTAAVAPSGASGQGGFGFEEVSFTVSVSSADLDVGEERAVPVELTDIGGDLGLGAWQIDIGYDPTVVAVTDCAVVQENSVCIPKRDERTVRLAGASASGITKDTRLAMITFRCVREGEGVLSVAVTGGVGIPEMIVSITTQEGLITCGPRAPVAVRVDDRTIDVGEEGSLRLRLADVRGAGIAAWQMGIAYDPTMAKQPLAWCASVGRTRTAW